MLFNSYVFIFVFMPITLVGYFAICVFGQAAPALWLALASFVFYSFGGWQFVPLLIASITFNYFVGYLLIEKAFSASRRLIVLSVGLSVDLVTLGIFKYAGFFVENLNAVLGSTFVLQVVLPVGI